MPHSDTNVFQWETLAPVYTSSTCMTRNPCILPCRASGKYTMPREGRFHVYQGILGQNNSDLNRYHKVHYVHVKIILYTCIN